MRYIKKILIEYLQIQNAYLSKCSELTIWKELSFHLMKYFHQALVDELSKYKPTDENVSNDLKDLEVIFDNLFDPIVHLSDESIQFCNYFHEEESENGIKVLLDLVFDEKFLSILFEPQTNNITDFLQRFIEHNSLCA
jgi:hypothetical protein